MTLDAGARLGPYEIVAPVGAGGMGEVYRARDTRLDRTVAVKVLPPTLASDAAFRERFEREARSISSLNHPNICTLHDVGHEGDVAYLVMEFVEGETLANRLSRGALPVADALRIATEIAAALDTAHRHGIVHRDLKPGNVMLAHGGSAAAPPIAKLLDFGLAKTGAAAVPSTVPTALVTHAPITAQGTILGTFQYMAPEQVEGEEADARTDLFALGAVLYEMVTGRRAFTGKSQASLLGAILKDEPPPVSQVVSVVPSALDHLIRMCLAKDRDARIQTAHDVLLHLKWIAEGGSAAGVPAPVAGGRRRRERMAWAATAVIGALWVATLAWMWPFGADPTSTDAEIRFEIPVSDATVVTFSAISPDGRLVAFSSRADDATQSMLTLRPLDSVTPRQLPGTEGGSQFFWSPDSRSVAFFAGGTLKRVDISGGVVQTICDLPDNRGSSGGSWNRNGVVIFAAGGFLYRVAAEGGIPVEMAGPNPEAGQPGFRWPSFLPDGQHLLYLGGGPPQDRSIYVASLDEPHGRRIMANPLHAQYASPGFLVFQNQGMLLAQPFDLDTLSVTGEAVRISDDLAFNIQSGRGSFTSSDSGVLAYRAGGALAQAAELVWVDQSGGSPTTLGEPGAYRQVALSPDEQTIAFSKMDIGAGRTDLWTLALATGVTSRLTFGTVSSDDPIWSPDGRALAYVSLALPQQFYQQALGSRVVSPILESPELGKFPHDWSRDGQFLLFHQASGLFVLPMTGDRTPRLLRTMQGSVDSGRFSPDGRWVAYGSNESGQWEVYVAPFPAFGQSRQVSSRGGVQPRWRGDSRGLYYLDREGQVMSVSVTPTVGTDGQLVSGAPVGLFRSPVRAPAANIDQWAVTRSGQRFLFIRPRTSAASGSPIMVVVNWQAPLAAER